MCCSSIHSLCAPQPICSAENLLQDLSALKRHLDHENKNESVSGLTSMIKNYDSSFNQIYDSFEGMKLKVTAATEADDYMQYNALKISIAE